MESFRFAIFIYGIHCICWAFRCVSYYFLCHMRISIQSHSPSVRPSARSGFMALSTFYLSHTCVYFLQSVFALLVLFLDFLFVSFRCVDCSLISCVCFSVRSPSLSFSNYVCFPLTLSFLAIFTPAFNIHHLFIVGVERLAGAPFFFWLVPSLFYYCYCFVIVCLHTLRVLRILQQGKHNWSHVECFKSALWTNRSAVGNFLLL